MTAITETDVVHACKTLFGNHVDISRDFLSYVQPSGVKSAYRRKAKENHPDVFALHPLHVQQKQTALFREIIRAYDIISLFFKEREEGAWEQNARRHRGGNAGGDFQARAKPTANAAPPNQGNGYYQGQVPFHTLQIGQYLYYRGMITFAHLVNALVWQRKQRPSMGEIAARWGWLDREGLENVLRRCTRARLFGEKAVELGLLTVFQVNTIIMYQRMHQERLGKYFTSNKLISNATIHILIRQLKEHNAAILAADMLSKRMSYSTA